MKLSSAILIISFILLTNLVYAQTYTYDRKSQLTGVDYGSFAIAYTYDKLGNRLTVQRGPELPTPVALMSFTGAVDNCAANLQWQVGLEEGIEAYRVERSVDGRSFSAIASVPATRSSVYSYNDAETPKGNAFYRLSIIEANKQPAYSHVLHLVNPCDVLSTVSLYPNPANDVLTLSFTSDRKNILSNFHILDIKGRPVLTTNFTSNGGAEHHNFNLSSLPAGSYVCILYLGGQKIAEEKIVIIKSR